jgi:hypothetical protein
MKQKITAFGVKVLPVPDPNLYLQAPGGQVFRLVGINEDLSSQGGGRTWWAHFDFTRINITPTILPQKDRGCARGTRLDAKSEDE